MDKTEKPSEFKIDETDPCATQISMSTEHGCADFSTTAWVSFLSDHPYILGGVLLIFGAIVTFYGRKFFQYTIAAVGILLGFLTTMLLFSIMGMLSGLESGKDSLWMTILSFLVAIIVALFLGFVMYKTIKFGAMLLGAISGGLIGATFYNLAFYAAESFYLFVFTVAFLGIVGAFLAYRYFDQIVILSTALIGSYCFIRGIAVYAGGWPNEMELINKIANDVEITIPYQLYIYISAVILLFILGSVFQFREMKKAKLENFTLQT
jgi:hypothetical protein